jgi:hypothetical protein
MKDAELVTRAMCTIDQSRTVCCVDENELDAFYPRGRRGFHVDVDCRYFC